MSVREHITGRTKVRKGTGDKVRHTLVHDDKRKGKRPQHKPLIRDLLDEWAEGLDGDDIFK